MNLLSAVCWFVGSFVTLSVTGLLAHWVDRKVTARVQWRVGPPWYQGFADFVKLSGKEVLIPDNANRIVFLTAPLLAVTASTVCGTLLFLVLAGTFGFQGDLILFLYLLALPSLGIIMAGSASGNVLASVGVRRELKLLLGYELPFICAVIVSVIKTGYTTSLEEILTFQQAHGAVAGSLSGLLAFLLTLLVIQAKLGLVPFDLAEAETEIAGGALIEYSGILLGLFKLAKAILLIVGPLFLITAFWGSLSLVSLGGIVNAVLKYVLILVLIVVIRNTNPRLRIDQALGFYWGWLTLLGIASILLALVGL